MRHAMCDYCITLVTQFPSLAQLSKGRVHPKRAIIRFYSSKFSFPSSSLGSHFQPFCEDAFLAPHFTLTALFGFDFFFAKNKDFLPNRLYRRELLCFGNSAEWAIYSESHGKTGVIYMRKWKDRQERSCNRGRLKKQRWLVIPGFSG